MCPRHYYKGIWWDATYYGQNALQDCPNDAVGDAKRDCTSTDVWLEPDLFNCTNKAFIALKAKVLLPVTVDCFIFVGTNFCGLNKIRGHSIFLHNSY